MKIINIVVELHDTYDSEGTFCGERLEMCIDGHIICTGEVTSGESEEQWAANQFKKLFDKFD